MRIATLDPIRTAARVRQLAAAHPLECAKAIAQQPEALSQVGQALAELANHPEAAEIVLRAIRVRPEFTASARPFYERLRALQPPIVVPPGYYQEVTTNRERP
jgi:hypothetical protein